MKKVFKLHYAIYTLEEWSYMEQYCKHLMLHYTTRTGVYPNCIEVIICCTDEMLLAMEQVTAKKVIEFV